MSSRLDIVSRERISEELIKGLTQSPKASKYFYLAFYTGLLSTIIPEFKDSTLILHDRRGAHVGESLPKHVVTVLTRLEKQSEPLYGINPKLRLATILHDIGKVKTMKIEEEKISFIDHEIVGAEIARETLKRLRFSNDYVQYVTTMIRYHMNMNEILRPRGKTRPYRRLRQLAQLYLDINEDTELGLDLLALAQADINVMDDNFISLNLRKFGGTPNILKGDEILSHPEYIRLASRIEHPERKISEIVKQMRLLQLSQGLDRDGIHKILGGEIKNVMEANIV